MTGVLIIRQQPKRMRPNHHAHKQIAKYWWQMHEAKHHYAENGEGKQNNKECETMHKNKRFQVSRNKA